MKSPVKYEPVGSVIIDGNGRLICEGIGLAGDASKGSEIGPFIADAINEKIDFNQLAALGVTARLENLNEGDCIIVSMGASPPPGKADLLTNAASEHFGKLNLRSGSRKTQIIVHFSETPISILPESDMNKLGWYRENDILPRKSIISLDTITMHCSKCKESGTQELKASDVKISMDLEKDRYQFVATCPDCGGNILNSRRTL